MTVRVLDASVLCLGALSSQYHPSAAQLLDEASASLAGPIITRAEFLNAGWALERRGLLSRAAFEAAIAQFESLDIEFLDSPAWPFRALETARRFNLPRIYDAIYLHCAEDIEGQLWTCDRRFVSALSDRPDYLRLCPDDLAG